MASPLIPQALRELVHHRAEGRCEYCQMQERVSGEVGEMDHIIPRSLGGPTTAENLCLACRSCNGHKANKTKAVDPHSGAIVPLFHPRQQIWHEHFVWSQDGTRIVGLTPCGRATVEALQFNRFTIVVARELWARFGQHPPTR